MKRGKSRKEKTPKNEKWESWREKIGKWKIERKKSESGMHEKKQSGKGKSRR